MPKIGDIKVVGGKGHRLMVWCGRQWKGVALENKKQKNSDYDIREIEPKRIIKKEINEKVVGNTETIDGGTIDEPTSIGLDTIVSLCDTNLASSHFLLENGIEGQMKVIVHNVKNNAAIDFQMHTKMSPGPGFTTATSNSAGEASVWVYADGFWYLIGGHKDFILT